MRCRLSTDRRQQFSFQPVDQTMSFFRSAVLQISAWVMLAFISYATISPISARPSVSTSPTYEHFVAFLVLGTLFALAYPRRLFLVGLIVIGSSFVLEASQLLTPDRHARFADVLEKATGGALGIACATMAVRFLFVKSPPTEPE